MALVRAFSLCMILFLLRETGAISCSLKEQYFHTSFWQSDGLQCPVTCAGKSGVYLRAAVATDVPACSKVGVDILKLGGSVIDSAVAALFCLGVINFQSVGLGGGGFLLYYNATSHQPTFLDFREVAPNRATTDMFHQHGEAPNEGGLAVGIPGQLKGMETAWKMHGRLPWADLIQPSINIARQGFNVSKSLSFAVEDNQQRLQSEKYMYNALRDLLVPNEKPLKAGQVIKDAKMARTLSKIAEHGADYLYNSSFTSTLVRELQEQGSIITEEDFNTYTVKAREVLKSNFNGFRVLGATAPSGGALVALILNILTGYNISHGNSGLMYHRLVEAFRMAYTWRPRLGDPDFNADMSEVIRRMMSSDEADIDALRSLIRDDEMYFMDASGFPRPSHVGTTHLSVLGPDGDAVAVTSTLNDFFGSLVYSNESGIIFNDEMFDFCEDMGPCKHIKPKSRPRSSMSPTILLKQDGSVKMVIGASGGSRIPTGITQVLLNVLYFNMSLSEAVAYPRIHHQINPDEVDVEGEFPEEFLYMLKERGHKVKVKEEESNDFGYSVVQAVEMVEGEVNAISDCRKGGAPSGF